MKTVIDAVNELCGDIGNIRVGVNARSPLSLIVCVSRNYKYPKVKVGDIEGYESKKSSRLSNDWKIICTVAEFNACVDELSAAAWIDGISLEEWKAGMKNTVIDSHGNELELNKIYEFSDHGIEWKASILLGLVDDEVEYLSSDSGWSMFIRECQSPLGTIKKAPVKLVDGKAYQFESVVTGRIWVGFYHSASDRFDESAGGDGSHRSIGDVSDFKNIIPLVPEVK